MSILNKNTILSGHIYSKDIKICAKRYTDENDKIIDPPPIIACNIKSEKTGDVFTLNLNCIVNMLFYKIELSDIVKYFDFIKSHNNDTFDPLFIRVAFNIQTNSTYTIENVYKLEDFINILDLNSNDKDTFYFYYINKKFINTKTDNIENINFIEEADFTTDNIFYINWVNQATDETKNSLQKDLSEYICIIVHIDNVNDLNHNIGILSHADGLYTTSLGYCSHSEGIITTASGSFSHAEGFYTTASGSFSHAEGSFTGAEYSGAHAEGTNTQAYGDCSHAEGDTTQAHGSYSHSEGHHARASGYCSHAEGEFTNALNDHSHAEGYGTIVCSKHSHAGGNYTIADIDNITVIGTYNKPTYNIYISGNNTIYIVGNKDIYDIKQQDDNKHYTLTNKETGEVMTDFLLYTPGEETLRNKIFVIGNGTSNDNRKNAFVITDTGDVYISGTIHCKEIIHDM